MADFTGTGVMTIPHFMCCGRYQSRDMLREDIESLLVIEQSSHLSPWSHSHFLSSINSGHQTRVLEHQAHQKIVAYCITSTAADEAELLNLTVAAEYRRRGLAQAFLTQVCRHFDDSIQQCFLEVRVSNLAAIALYQSLDFHEIACRPNYYRSGQQREDALIMAKQLFKTGGC